MSPGASHPPYALCVRCRVPLWAFPRRVVPVSRLPTARALTGQAVGQRRGCRVTPRWVAVLMRSLCAPFTERQQCGIAHVHHFLYRGICPCAFATVGHRGLRPYELAYNPVTLAAALAASVEIG